MLGQSDLRQPITEEPRFTMLFDLFQQLLIRFLQTCYEASALSSLKFYRNLKMYQGSLS